LVLEVGLHYRGGDYVPLLRSFSAPLVAWRDLKPFVSFFVVLRWWCDCAEMGAMLPLPPALNLNGIDATLIIDYQSRSRGFGGVKCGTATNFLSITLQFWLLGCGVMLGTAPALHISSHLFTPGSNVDIRDTRQNTTVI
jgi:hypothetical protein